MNEDQKTVLTSVKLLLFPLKTGECQKKVCSSAESLSLHFIECAATKYEFISIICSVVNNIGKSKIAPLQDKIAP